MRERQRFSPETLVVKYWSKGNGCSQVDWVNTATSTLPNHSGIFERISDVVTPNYFTRRRKGDIMMNPYTQSKRIVRSVGTGFHIKSKSQSCSSPLLYHEWKAEGNWFGSRIVTDASAVSVTPLISTNEVTDLLTQVSTCLENKRGRSSSNLWETVAELNQTRGLLGSLVKSFGQVLTRAGKVQKTKSASDFYLALRYGLTPLISDTENVLKSLSKTIGRVRKKSTCEDVIVRSASSTGSFSHDFVLTTYRVETKQRLYAKAVSIDELDASRLSHAGFTAKGLITLPWELTTLSFVVDWFVNVGDFLGAITPAFGWHQLGSCIKVEDDREAQYTCLGTQEASGTYAVLAQNSGSVFIDHKTHWRQGTLAPGIVIKANFGLLQGGQRDADAFFLLAQRLQKLTRIAQIFAR